MKFGLIALGASLLSGCQARCGSPRSADAEIDFVTMVSSHNERRAERKLVTESQNIQPAVTRNLADGPLTEEDVRAMFTLWDGALATEDSRIVATMYGKNSTLLPTLSDRVRTDFEGIKDYFDSFLAKDPRGEILEGHIRIGDDWATDVGIYEFTMHATGGNKVRGRYSYFYEPDENGDWKIAHHHSSMMPEEMQVGKQITEDEVKALFNLWNDALKTGDPKEVALRYSRDAVLLPTMKDDSRTDFCKIEDYFIHFLQNEPTGEILESNVLIGQNWAQDVGIYEFTMGTTGKKVKGRYSYVYVYEDGEWKISHHHSSVMPESIITAEPITEVEVRALFDDWNAALQTLDPYKVAALYSHDGNLLPTLSDKQRLNFLEIADYFVDFLKYEPVGEILSGDIYIGTNWAQDAGIYEFTMGTTGAKVRGRYTFVYAFEDGKWKIVQHHSSMMPEENKSVAISETEVKNLFQLWNSALLTRDPDAVARRYAKDAVLLPTVSDVPRDTYDLIKDYFIKFLSDGPTGEILESFVTIGTNWCSDVGIYEFTMRDTGAKVMGRYSFVYVFEDGKWMISHHHSSMMPEGGAGLAVSGATTRSPTTPGAFSGFAEETITEGGSGGIIIAVVAVAAVAAVVVGAVLFKKRNQNQSSASADPVAPMAAEEKILIEEEAPHDDGSIEDFNEDAVQAAEISCTSAKSLISGDEDI